MTGQLGASVGTAAIVAEWTTGKVKMVPVTKAGTSNTRTTARVLL